jgi:hypothetical protein
MNGPSLESRDAELTARELRGWIEIGCWTTLLLAPLLSRVNGPAVSVDQSVMRTGLVLAAASGAVGLRLYARRRPRRGPGGGRGRDGPGAPRAGDRDGLVDSGQDGGDACHERPGFG